MSTYWHFRCLDHDPTLMSVGEFTQHTDDKFYRAGVELACRRPIEDRPPRYWRTSEVADYFLDNAQAFLVGHPKCRVGLVNEYGESRDLPEVLGE